MNPLQSLSAQRLSRLARRAAAIATAAGFIGSAGSAWALDLTVEVTGAKSTQGHVMAALYDSEAGWLETPVRAERVAAAERCVLVFRNLPAGTYAVALLHDENGNGRHDRNVVGMPLEPFGFSRDATAKFSAPKFEAAAVAVSGDMTLTIKLQ